MSYERYTELVTSMCTVVGLPSPATVLERGAVEIEGVEIQLNHFENDPEAMYLNFHFGSVTAGRTLRVFRLLLEADMQIYEQDEAQMGVNTNTGADMLMQADTRTDAGDEAYVQCQR